MRTARTDLVPLVTEDDDGTLYVQGHRRLLDVQRAVWPHILQQWDGETDEAVDDTFAVRLVRAWFRWPADPDPADHMVRCSRWRTDAERWTVVIPGGAP